MARKTRVVFTVTNDLNYDQRMIRICTTLAEAGYHVTIVGFKRKNSPPLVERPYAQKRLPVVAEKGKIMYAHYWLRLFLFLMKRRLDIVCAIDLDTIMPVYIMSVLRNKKRLYDAHELFTDLKEVISRPSVLRMWNWIAKHTVHNFKWGYTVSEGCAEELHRKYGVDYSVVRSATVLKPITIPEKKVKYILYQGAVNVGRCFEQLIPAMAEVDAQLIICGEGNFYDEAVAIMKAYKLEDKVIFKGYVPPEKLLAYTLNAWVGITLFEETSLSNRYSLANRFFDYMHAGVPQLCVSYPEYEKINGRFEVARLISHVTPEHIAAALNKMLNDDAYHRHLQDECMQAREVYCWQQEAKTLLSIYERVVASAN